MPTNVVKTQADEEKWQKAKAIASSSGEGDNYAYIMGIYKRMNPDGIKSASPSRVASQYLKNASTNTDRNFFKAQDGNWYVENEDWNDDDYDEYRPQEFTIYGPFPSFKEAEKWMDRNFANSGSYHCDDSGRARVPRRPVKPKRTRWRFGETQPLQLQPDYHPCQHGGPCQCGGQCGCGK